MIILLVIIIGVLSIQISKSLLGKWFNHISLYTIIWMIMLVLYELGLMRFDKLRLETWVLTSFAFIAIWLGTLTTLFGRQIFKSNTIQQVVAKTKVQHLFQDGGKSIKISILILASFGLLSALYHWYILIKEFGSVLGAIINAALIYQMRIEGEVSTGIPYIFAGTHVALVLAGIYSAYKNKFSLFILYPFLVLMIKSIAEVSRAGILLGLFEFFIGFILFKQAVSYQKWFHNKKNVFAIIIIFILLVGSASLVKTIRAPFESYKASTRSLSSLEKNVIISPSIYLYISSHIGVFNDYLIDQDEENYFGEVTFFPFYRFISKFDVISEPQYYQRGYFIPMWTNTGTYLRDLHADFGYLGVIFIPYFLGLLATVFWFKFYEDGDYLNLILLIYTNIIFAFSFVVMATRFGNWLIGLIISLIILPFIQRLSFRYSNS